VAVKIIEFLEEESPGIDAAAAAAAAAGGESDSEDGGRGRALLEGLLQERVSHPHVVRNFKFLTRPVPGPSEDGRSGEGDGGDGDGSAGAPNGDEGGSRGGARVQTRRKRRRVMEAWLLLEFCNRGCIADGIDKGWFRLPHSMFEPAARPIITTAKEVAAAMAYLHSEVGRGRLRGRATLLLHGLRTAGLAAGAEQGAVRSLPAGRPAGRLAADIAELCAWPCVRRRQ
jgi:hypothetical protein